jgi:streptogramin lyase
MTETELEERIARMFADDADRPVDVGAAWRRFGQMRGQATRRTTRSLLAAGTAAVVALVAAGLPLAVRYLDGHPQAGPGGSHGGAPVGYGRLVIAGRIAVPGARTTQGAESVPGQVVSEQGRVWEITRSGYLIRIDPRTNRITCREHIPGASGLAAGAGALWVISTARAATAPEGQLIKLSPVSGQVETTFPLPRPCWGVSYAGPQLWAGCGQGDGGTYFLRFDPATGRVLASGGPARRIANMTATPYGIWYSSSSGVTGLVGTGGRLHRIGAPAGQKVTGSLVYADGALWSIAGRENVAEINPLTGRIIRTYHSNAVNPARSFGLDFFTIGQDSIWFLNDDRAGATSILRVSLATGRPAGQVSGAGSCGEPCEQVYFAQGSAWVPTAGSLARVTAIPLRRTGSR